MIEPRYNGPLGFYSVVLGPVAGSGFEPLTSRL
jgi:hypothetical protein